MKVNAIIYILQQILINFSLFECVCVCVFSLFVFLCVDQIKLIFDNIKRMYNETDQWGEAASCPPRL